MSLAEVWRTQNSLPEAVIATYNAGLEQGLPRGEVIEIILDLAGDRWREVKQFIPVPDYPVNDLRYGCQTDDYGTVVDPISLSEIPLERLITFQEEGRKWCFDIETLFEYVERGKALNPLTRRELPPEVQVRIQEYKTESEVVVAVHVDEDIKTPIRDFEVKFPNGFPMVELIVAIFRAWKESRHLAYDSAPELLARYVIPVEDFEEEVRQPRQLTIFPPLKIPALELRNYYGKLEQALRKRSSLAIFADYAARGFGSSLIRMTFLESAKYLGGWEGYSLVLVPSLGNNPFQYLKKESDYFRPLHKLTPGRSWTIKDIPSNFEQLYRRPEYDPTLTFEQRALLSRFFSNTIIYLFNEYTKQRNVEKLKALMEHMDPFLGEEGILLIATTFSPKETYDILQGKISAYILKRIEGLPKNLKESIYYYLLLGAENEAEAQAMLDLVSTGKTDVTDPVTQAHIVFILKKPEYFQLFKDTLDYNTLYKDISEHEDSIVDNFLPIQKRLERFFREGGTWPNDVTPEEARAFFNYLLETGTDKIDEYAFQFIIGLSGEVQISADEIYTYILRSVNKENIFRAILKSLGESIFLNREEDVSYAEYMQLICRIADSEDLSEESKMQAFQYILESDFDVYDELVQELYNCIGLERAIELFTKFYNKEQKFLPKLTLKGVTKLMQNNQTLLQEIFNAGLLAR